MSHLFFFLLIILTILSSSSVPYITCLIPLNSTAHPTDYLVSNERLQAADVLLSSWRNWSKTLNVGDTSPDLPPAPSLPGDPCSVPSSKETLQVMYYRRIQHTLKLFPSREYRVLRHIADGLGGYYAKMGERPPSTPEYNFCKAPDYYEWEFTTVDDDHDFLLWPPSVQGQPSYYLMCQNSRCTECSQITDGVLKEACALREIKNDGWFHQLDNKTKQAQSYYPRIKSLWQIWSSPEEMANQVGFEGANCTASPAVTLAFAQLMRGFSVVEISSLESHKFAIQEIEFLKTHLEPLKFLVKNYSKGFVSSDQFCNINFDKDAPKSTLDPEKSEWWMIGALVCGSKTCKPCKETPVVSGGPQRWTYEGGLLQQACNFLTEPWAPAKSKEELEKAQVCSDEGDACPIDPPIDHCQTTTTTEPTTEPPGPPIVSTNDYLVTLPRLEDAEELLRLWYTWLTRPGSELVKHSEGDNCNVSPEQTLRLTYLRRFWYTLDLRPNRRYWVLRHLAERLDYYKAKMGPPPSKTSINQFCSYPSEAPAPDFPTDTGLFMWPPRPYHLMCENSKCVPCSKVTSPELKEACDLPTPPSDEWWKSLPAEELSAQIMHPRLPHLKSVLANPAELAKQKKVEGQECSATAKQTLAYVTLLKKFQLKEVMDMESHVAALEDIDVVKRNLVPFNYMLENYENNHFFSDHFCPVSLQQPQPSQISPSGDANHAEYWLKGAYVCGAGAVGDNGTCKPCKEPPIAKIGRQEWSYQRGELHEACSLLTQLYDGAKSLEELERCDTCDKLDPCDIYKNVNQTIVQSKGLTRQYVFNYDRWKAREDYLSSSSSNSISNNAVYIKPPMTLIIASLMIIITQRLMTYIDFCLL